jgi:hypothetical protein
MLPLATFMNVHPIKSHFLSKILLKCGSMKIAFINSKNNILVPNWYTTTLSQKGCKQVSKKPGQATNERKILDRKCDLIG